MKKTRLLLGAVLALLTSTSHAELFNFDGSLTFYDGAGVFTLAYPNYTGQVEYDAVTQIGSANFDPVMFKASDLIIHDVVLTQIDGTLHADGLWDWGVTLDQFISWDWLLTALPGGTTNLTLIDTDNDGVPGTALTSGPFLGVTMAIEGVTSPVPLPAAIWLFGSGLISLIGLARSKA